MSRHHGRRRGYFYGCARNWKRGPAICQNNLHLPKAVLDEAVLDAMVLALDAELVEAAVAQAFIRLTETAAETGDRRQMLESQIAEGRRREQRLADAISQGAPGEAAPQALLNTLRTEETRRKALEQRLAMLSQLTAVVSVDRDRVARDLRSRADDMRGVLRRQGAQAREALRTLLVDRFDCTPVLVAGARGYAFTGDGTFGGLLASSTWPTTFGGPKGKCHLGKLSRPRNLHPRGRGRSVVKGVRARLRLMTAAEWVIPVVAYGRVLPEPTAAAAPRAPGLGEAGAKSSPRA